MEHMNDPYDLVRETLHQVIKKDMFFNGNRFKQLTLGATRNRPMSQQQLEAMNTNSEDYMRLMGELLQDMAACGDNKACIKDVETRMLEIEMNYRNASMGHTGTMYESELMELNQRMGELGQKMIDKEYECSRIN